MTGGKAWLTRPPAWCPPCPRTKLLAVVNEGPAYDVTLPAPGGFCLFSVPWLLPSGQTGSGQLNLHTCITH